MYFTINNLKTFYEISGKGKSILLLHGWGGNHNSWFPVTQILQKRFRVITLDLPGFGQTQFAEKPWHIKDYVNFVSEFFHDLKPNAASEPNNLTIVGHSFGGTIAAQLAICNPQLTKNLILVDAKLIKPHNTMKKSFYQVLAKSGKIATNLLSSKTKEKLRKKLYQQIGEHDYEQTSGVLRQNFLNIISKDYRAELAQISAKTLIVWGEKDQDTPLTDAKAIYGLIPNSKLVTFENAGHFSYLDETDKFCKIVKSFIMSPSGRNLEKHNEENV